MQKMSSVSERPLKKNSCALKDAEPRILCEMSEITDESWRNAVEGYLNTQRFYILVEPDSFDIALGIYDRLRKEKRHMELALSIHRIWNSMIPHRKDRWLQLSLRKTNMQNVISI